MEDCFHETDLYTDCEREPDLNTSIYGTIYIITPINH